jgi:uncharacterized protein YbdZ (MbtH family)
MSEHDLQKEDTTIYKVVINHEEQYSIWPDYKELPLGWTSAGRMGPKAECLAYIKDVWTDMRPLSLRKKMAELPTNPPLVRSGLAANTPREKSLVDRLCEGDHPLEVGLRPERNAKLFREAINRDYVLIKFTDTKGGTEIGCQLDRRASDFTGADFENERGTVHLEGTLTLDYVNVRCIADINLSTYSGNGHLTKVAVEETSVA